MTTQTNPLKPKKMRTKRDGSREERDETDRERRDRVLPGMDDLKKLSLGIMEDEEECLIDDEINDEEEDEEKDCLIPLNWAQIASSHSATQEKMRQTIQEARDRQKKKKEPKKNCEPGNPWKNSLGQFSSPDKAASWSIGNQSGVGRSDCNYGKKKKTGKGRSTSWTKRECGREDVTDPNKKAKHRCKDGSVVKEQDDPLQSAWDLTTSDSLGSKISDRLLKVLDRDPNFIKHLAYLVKPLIDHSDQSERSAKHREKPHYSDLNREKPHSNRSAPSGAVEEKKDKGMTRDQVRDLCARSGFFGWTDFLLKLSAIEQAKKGTINQKKN